MLHAQRVLKNRHTLAYARTVASIQQSPIRTRSRPTRWKLVSSRLASHFLDLAADLLVDARHRCAHLYMYDVQRSSHQSVLRVCEKEDGQLTV